MSSKTSTTMVRAFCDGFLWFLIVFVVNPKTGRSARMISKETYEVVMANAETLDSAIIYERDFQYNL